jgi:hypothetical protein
MGFATTVVGLMRTVKRATLAPPPCAGCADGHAEQDWSVNLSGQVTGLCSHCGEYARQVEKGSKGSGLKGSAGT